MTDENDIMIQIGTDSGCKPLIKANYKDIITLFWPLSTRRKLDYVSVIKLCIVN